MERFQKSLLVPVPDQFHSELGSLTATEEASSDQLKEVRLRATARVTEMARCLARKQRDSKDAGPQVILRSGSDRTG